MDRFPKRIVCLTEETTETLYALGVQDRIVGISGFTMRPPHARKEKPLVSAFTTADLPKIMALQPDLVLAFSDLQADIVRAEDVVAADPDLIVASWCGKMVKPEKIVAREGFERVKAVRAKRIHEIKGTIILQPGPACLTDGLRAMHELVANTAQEMVRG